MSGTFYIIAAPSGAGKTSLVNALIKEVSNLAVSVSHTTRAQRPGEEDGVNYFFVSEGTFTEMSEQDAFLEQAVVFGNHYGTSRVWVESQLERGIDVILEIDWQGAAQIRTLYPKAQSIYILPPSLPVLEQRLVQRGQDQADTIRARMAQAKDEMSHWQEFDYLVINDDFTLATQQLASIIRAKRCETAQQKQKHKELLSKLV